MRNMFLTVEETSQVIRHGSPLVIAGDESMLSQLPKGNWIGGTTAYFMTKEQDANEKAHLLVSVLHEAMDAKIISFTAATLSQILDHRYDHGFIYLLLPAFSDVHTQYGLYSSLYPGLFDQPITGWITGTHLTNIGIEAPKVFNGKEGEVFGDRAVAFYLQLPNSVYANLNITNPFIQNDGVAIIFPETGFSVTICTIDGKQKNFAHYIFENDLDITLPLMVNYTGAMVNVSIQEVDVEAGIVTLYAPVIAGQTYHFAKSIHEPNGIAKLSYKRNGFNADSSITCNCVLNYVDKGLLHSNKENYTGPVTFGEIAYILLNQTMVSLSLEKHTNYSI